MFVRPDFHCSFFYRDEFRKQGWKADIFVDDGYPENLLYSKHDVLQAPRFKSDFYKLVRLMNHLLLILWWLTKFWRYEFHCYYGSPPTVNFYEQKFGLTRLFGESFLIELWLSKLFGIKLLYLPTGCHNEETRANYLKLDDGNICNNCGFYDRCDDSHHNLNFSRIRRYFSTTIGPGSVKSTQFQTSFIKYKSIDLNLWNEGIKIPSEHQLPQTSNLRVLHSTYLEKSGRNWKGKNIKGTPFVLAAVERLKEEGYPVQYFYITDKPSNQMRFYQAQADIVVEQLIYGSWGSTGVETMALGKPVICYLRPSWKAFFLNIFPEYNELPIIEANTNTVYEAIKKLVEDPNYRKLKGKASRQFAEAHFDPEKNTQEFIKMLETL